MDAKFTFTKVVTDERMLIDIPLPGLTQNDVIIKHVPIDDKVVVKIDSTIKNGFGFRKKLIGYKDKKEFYIDGDYFDLNKIGVEFEKGVLRIIIPKMPKAVGIQVYPTE